MIVTLTPNPSLDLLFTADRLVWDDANRLPMPRRRPGGQGINVVRAARALAGSVAGGRGAGSAGSAAGPVAHAVAPLGGPVGRELQAMLVSEGAVLTGVPIADETRVFVGVRESATRRSLLLNPRGPAMTEAEADALLDAVDRALTSATQPAGGAAEAASDRPASRSTVPPDTPWLAACGSLLPGLPADFYARAGRLARRRGARFVPDGDGTALAAAVPEADLLVPNALEAGRLVGRAVEGRDAAVAAGRELLDQGPERVVVTLGADGAVMVDQAGAWRARPVPPPGRVEVLASSSAVGAGDAFLAGLLLALDAGPASPDAPVDALADAVAAGTAALLSTGAALVTVEAFREVRGWVEVDG